MSRRGGANVSSTSGPPQGLAGLWCCGPDLLPEGNNALVKMQDIPVQEMVWNCGHQDQEEDAYLDTDVAIVRPGPEEDAEEFGKTARRALQQQQLRQRQQQQQHRQQQLPLAFDWAPQPPLPLSPPPRSEPPHPAPSTPLAGAGDRAAAADVAAAAALRDEEQGSERQKEATCGTQPGVARAQTTPALTQALAVAQGRPTPQPEGQGEGVLWREAAAVDRKVDEAALGRAASPDATQQPDEARLRCIQGTWVNRACSDWVHTVEGGCVRGPDGSSAPIEPCGSGAFCLHLEGVEHRAQLRGAHLLWDDGDVWIFQDSLTAFDGLWTHKQNSAFREFIKGDTILGLDGTVVEVCQRTTSSISISMGVSTHHAELNAFGQLAWDDGDVWIKASLREASEGRWKSLGGDGHTFLIAEDSIYGPDGSTIPIVDRVPDALFILFLGARRRGGFNGSQIRWENGDVWARVEERADAKDEVELEASDQALWIAQVRRVSNDREEEMLEELGLNIGSPLAQVGGDAREKASLLRLLPGVARRRGNDVVIVGPSEQSAD
mmetsp:Transcript_109191/g.348548  ORF Transcript_109191/g.348548 Transcript_109191/m.348548 type:complete len:550 (+) Transcript_109191:75-1724(+)